VTIPGELTARHQYSHRYAKMENNAVVMNTPISSIFFPSTSLTAGMHTAEMKRRLNAADPTIVEGPSSPAGSPSL